MAAECDDSLLFLVDSSRLLDENVKHLIEKNCDEINNYGWRKVAIPKPVVQFIYEICDDYSKNRFVKYQAIEILLRYMIYHIVHLERSLNQSGVKKTLDDDIFLYAYTSVRLADKLNNMYDHISAKEVVVSLNKHGIKSNVDIVNTIEKSMLKKLKFKINFVIVPEFIEVILRGYKTHMHLDDVRDLRALCFEILDTLFPHIEELFRQLYTAITKETTVLECHAVKYYKIRADYLSLALGIITSASYMLNSYDGEKTISILHIMTNYGENNIAFYATHVIKKFYTLKKMALP